MLFRRSLVSRNQHALLMVGYMVWIAADMTIMNNNNVSNILQQLLKVSFLSPPLSLLPHYHENGMSLM